MNRINKILIAFSIVIAAIIGFNACKKDYIDYGQLDADEFNARENYLSQNYNTIQLTEDGRTFTALLIDTIGGIDTIKPTSSGLYYIDETPEEDKENIGPAATIGRLVKANYTGWLLDGTQFDSGEDFSFVYGSNGIISGWNEGISAGEMKKGETARLIIPSGLAYGYTEQKDTSGIVTIPRASTLVFVIKLTNVQK
jgi:hypothetical protein